MSRGPGRWQRMLLESLESGEMVSVVGRAWELAGPLTRAQEVAVRRAARRLHEDGKARVFYRMLPVVGGGRSTHQLVIAPTDSDHRGDIRPLNEPAWMSRGHPSTEAPPSVDRRPAPGPPDADETEIRRMIREDPAGFAKRVERALADYAQAAGGPSA